jgi:hypothetical protein
MVTMGIWKCTGKIVWVSTKLTAKASTAIAGLGCRCASATTKAIFHRRGAIVAGAAKATKVAAKTSIATAEATCKAAAFTTKKIYNNREEIAGTVIGSVNGVIGTAQDVSGHLISPKSINEQLYTIEMQSHRYRDLTQRNNARLCSAGRQRDTLFDTLMVGGNTLASYISSGQIPEDIQRAYELTYPNVAANISFIDQVQRLEGKELLGFVSGIKGKLFELQYADYLNEGILPDGFRAELAESPTNPGWDIAILGQDDELIETIQAKATNSVAYVKGALEQYPHIDVVTTSEVHSHLVMQGFSEGVIDSGISESDLAGAIYGAIDDTTISMDWAPSALLFALIAFSAYNREGLTAYQKSLQFGERSVKSYLAYLAGGGLAVATNTWWLGVLGGMGTRMVLGSGKKKRDRLTQLKQLVDSNRNVLKRLEEGAAAGHP